MQPSCSNMLGTSTGTPGSTALMNGFGPSGTGLGPLELVGILLLASLAFGLLLWMMRQRRPAREGIAASFAQPRLWQGEPRDEPSLQEWSYPPASLQASYEQPRVDYPEMPYDRPHREHPQE